MSKRCAIFFLLSLLLSGNCALAQSTGKPIINKSGYIETRGLNFFLFHNRYGLFGDEKASGLEIIHHGVRTATNGDVRLDATPEQWDSIPRFIRKEEKGDYLQADLEYPSYHFTYSIRVTPSINGVTVTVDLENELPKELEGMAGFNLEFLPAAYFGKSYLTETGNGLFPLYPSGPMKISGSRTDPLALIKGKSITLAPDDPERRIHIESSEELGLYDGRNKAQNGWFVVRSLLPAGKKGKVLEWKISASIQPNWTRAPVIGHSQLGYHPQQQKIAVLELDKNVKLNPRARLLRVESNGDLVTALDAPIVRWGDFLRYQYYRFDFSAIRQPGIYQLEYAGTRTAPFRIAENLYKSAWHPTLDVFFPVQMDHMFVNEAYRVWHGRSHMDDALQAPIDHIHFDLYAQGPSTDNRFKPGEHISGLNTGGWYDAGDYDIRTQTQYAVIMSLVQSWELFRPERDETLIDQKNKYADMHHPDGRMRQP